MLRAICLSAISFTLLVGAAGAAILAPNEAGEASYSVRNAFTVNVPKGAKSVRMWFALPQQDAASTVSNLEFTGDTPVRLERDSWGNQVGYAEVKNPTQDKLSVAEQFDFKRSEVRNQIDPAKTRPLTDEERAALAPYLRPTKFVVVNDKMKELAASIVGGETNPVLMARKLYDWTYKNVDYWVKDPEHHKASAMGSSEYCLSNRTGNCSDFHSLFCSLAMSSGIPTRIVYGSVFKPMLNGTETDASYHCWVQFYAPGLGWLPADPSMANMYAEDIALNDKNKKLVLLTTPNNYHGAEKDKVDFYFGNLDDRRVVWSIGRDLMMQPPQEDGPVNALIKMYLEVDGKQSPDWTRVLTCKEEKK